MASNWSHRVIVAILTPILGMTLGLAADAPPPKAPPRTVADIAQILTSYKPDPKRVEEMRALQAILDSQPPQTTDRKELARFYLKKANAASGLGALNVEADSLAKAVEFGGGDSLATELRRLSLAEAKIASPQKALATNKRALDATPQGGAGVMTIYSEQALLYARLGDIEETRKAMARSESEYLSLRSSRAWGMMGTFWTYGFETYRSLVLSRQGKLVEAEVAMRKAIEANHEDLRNNQVRIAQNILVIPQSEIERRSDQANFLLAEILAAQGRLSEAEVSARDAFYGSASRTGGGSVQTAINLISLVVVLQQQGRYREAEQISSACIANLERAGIPPDAFVTERLRIFRANALVAQGRYAEASAEYLKLHAAVASNPDAQAKLAIGTLEWSLALLKTGKADESLAMLVRLIPKSQQWLGDKHLDTMELVGVKAMALAVKGDKSAALETFRSALPILSSHKVIR